MSTSSNAMISGVAEYQGVRPTMEDCHVVDAPPCLPGQLYAVLDGHGGSETSEYCSKHLPSTLCQHVRNEKTMKLAMVRTFEDLDKQVAKHVTTDAGSTCSLALHVGNGKWWTANVGDSAVFWVPDQGNSGFWTTFHRPEDPYEQQRIKHSGGLLIKYSGLRVCGNRKHLAVSRSFGDHSMKYSSNMKYYQPQPGIQPKSIDDLLVSWMPDVKSHQTTTSGYLVLACDGLWDYVQPNYVTTAVRYGHSINETPPQLAQRLVETAKNGQTRDNVTVLVVRVNM